MSKRRSVARKVSEDKPIEIATLLNHDFFGHNSMFGLAGDTLMYLCRMGTEGRCDGFHGKMSEESSVALSDIESTVKTIETSVNSNDSDDDGLDSPKDDVKHSPADTSSKTSIITVQANRKCSRALLKMSEIPLTRQELCGANGIESIMSLMKTAREDPLALHECFATLANIATVEDGSKRIISSQTICSLGLLTEAHSSPLGLYYVALAIARMTRFDGLEDNLLREGCLILTYTIMSSSHASLIHFHDRVTRKNKGDYLNLPREHKLSIDTSMLCCIATVNLAPFLIGSDADNAARHLLNSFRDLIAYPTQVTIYFVARSICSLTFINSFRLMLSEGGTIELFKEMLLSSSAIIDRMNLSDRESVLDLCASSLCNLVLVRKYRKEMINSGIIALLSQIVELTHDEYVGRLVATAITSLCSSADLRKSIVEQGAIYIVLKLLGLGSREDLNDENHSVYKCAAPMAAESLAGLLCDAYAAHRVHELENGLTSVIRIINCHQVTLQKVQYRCIVAISNGCAVSPEFAMSVASLLSFQEIFRFVVWVDSEKLRESEYSTNLVVNAIASLCFNISRNASLIGLEIDEIGHASSILGKFSGIQRIIVDRMTHGSSSDDFDDGTIFKRLMISSLILMIRAWIPRNISGFAVQVCTAVSNDAHSLATINADRIGIIRQSISAVELSLRGENDLVLCHLATTYMYEITRQPSFSKALGSDSVLLLLHSYCVTEHREKMLKAAANEFIKALSPFKQKGSRPSTRSGSRPSSSSSSDHNHQKQIMPIECDIDIAKKALTADNMNQMACCFHDISFHICIDSKKAIEALVTLSSSTSGNRVCWCCVAIANISSFPKGRSMLGQDSSVIYHLVAAMRAGCSQADKVQRVCAMALSNILGGFQNEHVMSALVQQGIVQDLVVVAVLRANSVRTKEHLGRALYNLVSYKDIRDFVCDSGALDAVVRLRNENSPELRQLCVTMMYNLSCDIGSHIGRLKEVDAGKIAIEMLSHSAGVTEMKRRCAASLISLASTGDDACIRILEQPSIGEAIYKVSAIGSEESTTYCCALVFYLSKVPQVVRLAGSPVIPTILTLSKKGSVLLKNLTISAMINICIYPVFHGAIANIGSHMLCECIEQQHSTFDFRKDAFHVVYNMVQSVVEGDSAVESDSKSEQEDNVTPNVKIELVQNNIGGALSSYLRILKEDIDKLEVVEVIHSLCQVSAIRHLMVASENFIPMLVRLSKSDSIDIRLIVSATLSTLSSCISATPLMVEQGVMDGLFWLTLDDSLKCNSAVSLHVGAVFQNCSIDKRSCKKLSGCEKLLQVARKVLRGEGIEGALYVACALLNLCSDEDCQRKLLRMGLVGILVDIASKPDDRFMHISSASLHTIPFENISSYMAEGENKSPVLSIMMSLIGMPPSALEIASTIVQLEPITTSQFQPRHPIFVFDGINPKPVWNETPLEERADEDRNSVLDDFEIRRNNPFDMKLTSISNKGSCGLCTGNFIKADAIVNLPIQRPDGMLEEPESEQIVQGNKLTTPPTSHLASPSKKSSLPPPSMSLPATANGDGLDRIGLHKASRKRIVASETESQVSQVLLEIKKPKSKAQINVAESFLSKSVSVPHVSFNHDRKTADAKPLRQGPSSSNQMKSSDSYKRKTRELQVAEDYLCLFHEVRMQDIGNSQSVDIDLLN